MWTAGSAGSTSSGRGRAPARRRAGSLVVRAFRPARYAFASFSFSFSFSFGFRAARLRGALAGAGSFVACSTTSRVAKTFRPCSSKSITVWCSLTSTSVPAPYVGWETLSPLVHAFMRLPPRLATPAAAAAAAVASAAAVSAAAAESALRFRTSFIDRQRAATHLVLIQFGGSFLRFLVGGHLDEREPAGTTG